MITPDDAFRDLLLSLAQLKAVGRIHPESHACALAPHPDYEPWQVSLVIQSSPLGLRVGGLLPLHRDPAETDIEGLLRCCNDLNRQPLPFTFSLDPLGLVLSFRSWLPLLPQPGAMPRLTALALNLAEHAVHAATSRLQLGEPVYLTDDESDDDSLLDAPRDDEIPF